MIVFPTSEEMAEIGYVPSGEWFHPPLDCRKNIVAAINNVRARRELKRRGYTSEEIRAMCEVKHDRER